MIVTRDDYRIIEGKNVDDGYPGDGRTRRQRSFAVGHDGDEFLWTVHVLAFTPTVYDFLGVPLC
jgi:hypothetical protein